jgi:YD repeat-containing protein
MKNILGKHENLILFNEQGKKVYEYYKDSDGFWSERTYDEKGNILTYKNSDGYWREYTYDKKGKALTFKDSSGYWSEYTRDEKGNLLTYKDSKGVTRGFDIPEYTMEELVNKIGNFKIKK